MTKEVSKEELTLGALPKEFIEQMIQKLYEDNKDIFDTMSALQRGLQIEVKVNQPDKEDTDNVVAQDANETEPTPE